MIDENFEFEMQASILTQVFFQANIALLKKQPNIKVLFTAFLVLRN